MTMDTEQIVQEGVEEIGIGDRGEAKEDSLSKADNLCLPSHSWPGSPSSQHGRGTAQPPGG